MVEPTDFLPIPPDKGPPLPRFLGVKWRQGTRKCNQGNPDDISDRCRNIVFLPNLVYDRGVALEYDLTCDRLDDAKRRLADLEDMIPQVYGLTELTTREERENLVKRLGKVKHYIQEGDTLMGMGAADEFNATFRDILWNIIARCEC